MSTQADPSNIFVRLVMFASRAPFWGGSVLMFVMLAPGVILGGGVAVLLSSLISFARTGAGAGPGVGDIAWVIADAPMMFPDQPRLAILAGLPPATVSALTLPRGRAGFAPGARSRRFFTSHMIGSLTAYWLS